jgi:hypothetical protein
MTVVRHHPSFYQASRISVDELDDAKQTCQAVWLRMAGCAE